jgi:PIN domain nuclease of toxin-antitoxin system
VNGILLDTHAFLWWVADDSRLSAKARTTVTNADDVFLSVASCWEMAIKVSLGTLTLSQPVDRFVAEHLGVNQFTLLPVHLEHTSRVAALTFHHRDPFDRLLAAQALHEGLTLISADPVFRKYKVKRAW